MSDCIDDMVGDWFSAQEEIKQLQRKNAELKQELITRVGELQVMSEEKAELKAHVEELRDWLFEYGKACLMVNELEVADDIRGLLAQTPTQSLADHDREVAEKVREACAKLFSMQMTHITGMDARGRIRNMDIDEALKDEHND